MRILYAEDERSLARAVKAILEKNKYSVDVVPNGREALDYLDAGNYDAVILDVMMPVMDGVTALRTLRGRGDKTPVLMLTAKAEVEDKVEGLDSGANDYLSKPFDTRELLARLRVITRSDADGGQDVCLRLGNITLNRSTFELSGPGGTQKLANKEYQMLEMMMRSPRTILSVDRFMDHIWGFDAEADSSVVWVYISYLRKRLDAVGANVRITARRNAGYSLEETEA